MSIRFWIIAAAVTATFQVSADYRRTGAVKGESCADYLIYQKCKWHNVDGIRRADGIYAIADQYPEVTEHNAKSKRCWVNTKSKGMGFLSGAINAATAMQFVEKTPGGKFEDVDINVITFPCEKY